MTDNLKHLQLIKLLLCNLCDFSTLQSSWNKSSSLVSSKLNFGWTRVVNREGSPFYQFLNFRLNNIEFFNFQPLRWKFLTMTWFKQAMLHSQNFKFLLDINYSALNSFPINQKFHQSNNRHESHWFLQRFDNLVLEQ